MANQAKDAGQKAKAERRVVQNKIRHIRQALLTAKDPDQVARLTGRLTVLKLKVWEGERRDEH